MFCVRGGRVAEQLLELFAAHGNVEAEHAVTAEIRGGSKPA